MALSTAEDTSIKCGAGPVERQMVQQEPDQTLSVGDYLRMQREKREGKGRLQELLEKKRAEQAPLREEIEHKLEQMLAEEARFT